MREKRTEIPGYEGLYEITETGRVITLRRQRPMRRCNDDYGFHIVSLTNRDGERQNHNVYELWKDAFGGCKNSVFNGTLKIKYGKGCERIYFK